MINTSFIKIMYGDIGEILLDILNENITNLENILFVSFNYIEELKIKDSIVIPFVCLEDISDISSILDEETNSIVFFGLKYKLDENTSSILNTLADYGYRIYLM